MKNILSFGAGVNSTAILALQKLGKIDLDDFKVIFADTGAENPATYCHIDRISTEFNIEVVTHKPSLYDYCFEKKIIPSRMFRWCTDKWKIQPISNYLKKEGIIDYKLIFGFAKGEENRIKNRNETEYPLINLGIDREGCKKVIKEAGWEIPPKSGCFFCPFQHKLDWIALRENLPPLFKKAVHLEENCMRQDLFLNGDRSLSSLDRSQTRFSPLDLYQHCLCNDS